ncbi:MAG: EAL domain-containing protein [Solirubrobacterales bacterium]|nr:EAL domain-containing protein [Solirubrobacterales bacterium]
MEKHLSNPDERADRNIPDSEERRLYRGRIAEAAGRAVLENGPDPDGIWAEAAGPGSYRWLWTRWIQMAPQVLGWASLLFSVAAVLGWILDVPFLTGEFLNAPAFPVASAIMIGLLATVLLLCRPGRSEAAGRMGVAIGYLTMAMALLLLFSDVVGIDPVDWGDSSLMVPAFAALINVPVLALALVTIDLDAPRYRWQAILVPALGIAFLVSLLTNGYKAVLVSGDTLSFSYTGALALVLVYVGYVLMRPERGLAAFLSATGPGPSMARLLVPTALLIPLTMVLAEIAAEGLDAEGAAFVKGLDKILMLVLLLWMITYASRRLQRFYESWKEASSELASQANVLTRMSEGVVVMRISDTRIVLTNPQFDAMHGYRRGELIGRPIDTIAPPDLSEAELKLRSEVLHELADRGETSYESRSVRKDGSDIWSRVNGVVTTVPGHGPVLILVKYDVTEEHRAKHAGRDAEMRFRQVFEQSPIGLCLVTPEGRFEKVNQSFELITGYSSGELAGMTFSDITHPADLEEDLALTGELFAGERDGFSMEKRYIRKNGEVVWVYLTVAMLRDPDGHPYQALSMVEDITERQRMSQQLQYLADHDPLTGLFNRRRFEEELNSAVTSGAGRGIAILVIDLDNFKFVNDSYGHTVGDRLIVRTAELLRSRLRADDTLARQGGDEFVVVLRDINPEDALATAEELVRLVARDVRVEGAEHSAKVTASIGVAVSSQGKPVPEETLMMQADIAMYEAKDAGRNGARVFHPGEDSHVTLGIDWAGRLRGALENDELLVYAQPIYRLGETGPPHHELFVRMRDRNGSIILPGAFLPTAERHDLVQELDSWVIRKAISTLAGLDAETCPRLQINLSGRTVGDPKLPGFVQSELERTGVDPANLIFEVTETSAIGNMTRAQEFSARMNELGCGFALDDFGTGFASFYYLKHLAFDYVKIDGEFVQNLASDPVNRLLVKALVEISRGMGKQTVAEQVEDARTLGMLREFGVDFVQGHFLGRPRPLERADLTDLPEIQLDTPVRS